MGDNLGRTVKVDDTSLSRTRGKFARACVEIDLAAPLLPSLTIFDFAQQVEYEGLHLICFQCGRYGHRGDTCPANQPVAASPPVPVDPQPSKGQSSSSSPYGPWILPNYRHKLRHNNRRPQPSPSTAKPPVRRPKVSPQGRTKMGPSRASDPSEDGVPQAPTG